MYNEDDSTSLRISQKNSLAYAAYEMQTQEKRLLLLAMAKLTKDSLGFPCWEIPVSQIAEFLGMESKHAYREIQRVCLGLMSRVAKVPDETDDSEDQSWTAIQFVSKCRYISGKKNPSGRAVLEIKLHDEMAPYLLELKDRFNTIQFDTLANMTSIHAMRVFELLHHKRNETGHPKNEIIVPINELRQMLRLEKKYPSYADLKKNVLEVAKGQINEKTPMGMSYQELRERTRGRPVKAIKFKVWDKSAPVTLPAVDAQLLMQWEELSWKDQQIALMRRFETYMDKGKFEAMWLKMRKEGIRDERILANLEKAFEQISKNPEKVENLVAYCLNAIKNNWARV